MKKYTVIAWLTILIIACLQGYYTFLQYGDYIAVTLASMDEKLQIAIDREYDNRVQKKRNKVADDDQQFAFRKENSLKKGEKDFATTKGAKEFRPDTVDIDRLRKLDIVSTTSDVMAILQQDFYNEDGMPMDLGSLYSIFKSKIGGDFDCALLMLDCNKNPIQTIGKARSRWYATKDICISLKNPRFVRAMVEIPISDFIFSSILSLVLSALFSVTAMASVAYQLMVIRQKEELLQKRELSINGTIHDLKSPLNSAVMLLKYLQPKTADPAMNSLMGKAVDKISQLVVNIESLMIIARGGENRKIALKLEQADMLELAENAKHDVDTIFEDKPHIINVTGNATAIVDKMYVENVLRNLMENAVRYADNGVEVNAKICNQGGKTIICVEDNGWGIPRKSMRHLFKQFYRVPRQDGSKGYGIGLAFVKYVVEAHGGYVGVESEEGKGSIFRIEI